MNRVISIVIPYYCTPKQLFDRCMNSILNVQEDDVEVIVIDDGSPKDFYPILNSYTNNPQVKLIHTKNAGVSSARNRGIREANGDWILFADSDDYMNTKTLKKVLSYAKNNSGDVVIFNGGSDRDGIIKYNSVFLKQGINYAAIKEDRISVMESALAVGLLPEGYIQYFSLGAPYCKLFRTEFIRNNQLQFDTGVKLAEDTLFALHVYSRAQDIKFVDLKLYYYVYYAQSATRKFRPGFSDDMEVFFDRVAVFLKDNNLTNDLEKAYYLRAQFEVQRSFLLEFFHPDNKDKNARNKYMSFIQHEPYYTALSKNYLPYRGGIRAKIKRYLINHGYGETFKFGQKCLKLVRSVVNSR